MGNFSGCSKCSLRKKERQFPIVVTKASGKYEPLAVVCTVGAGGAVASVVNWNLYGDNEGEHCDEPLCQIQLARRTEYMMSVIDEKSYSVSWDMAKLSQN